MTNQTEQALAPCPFCGAGLTSIRENGKVWTGQRYGDPASISVMHWCEPVEGQPSRAIERVGRDRPSAIAAWNGRAAVPTSEGYTSDGWQPIETAPRDGSKIILWWGGYSRYGSYLDNSHTSVPWAGWTVPSLEVRPTGAPTLWMPMPKGPKP